MNGPIENRWIDCKYLPTLDLTFNYLQKFSFLKGEAKFLTGFSKLYACFSRYFVDFCTTYCGVCLSFPFHMGMLFLIWKELGMGKFPHLWLSSHSEKEFLHSRLRRSWRNTLSLFLLSHSWGNFFPIPNSFQIRNNIPI